MRAGTRARVHACLETWARTERKSLKLRLPMKQMPAELLRSAFAKLNSFAILRTSKT